MPQLLALPLAWPVPPVAQGMSQQSRGGAGAGEFWETAKDCGLLPFSHCDDDLPPQLAETILVPERLWVDQPPIHIGPSWEPLPQYGSMYSGKDGYGVVGESAAMAAVAVPVISQNRSPPRRSAPRRDDYSSPYGGPLLGDPLHRPPGAQSRHWTVPPVREVESIDGEPMGVFSETQRVPAPDNESSGSNLRAEPALPAMTAERLNLAVAEMQVPQEEDMQSTLPSRASRSPGSKCGDAVCDPIPMDWATSMEEGAEKARRIPPLPECACLPDRTRHHSLVEASTEV